MALTPRLELRQSQSLVMTPQLQQAIKLLQFSNLELAEYVEQELEKNPMLERDEEDHAWHIQEIAMEQIQRRAESSLRCTQEHRQSEQCEEREGPISRSGNGSKHRFGGLERWSGGPCWYLACLN